jgi:glycosyltransferase involved in cell wall biosynthesis
MNNSLKDAIFKSIAKKYSNIDLNKFTSQCSFDDEIILSQSKHFPKISIIVPSFNQGEFIEATILSILNQNYPHTELIIIDGASTDKTLDIIKKYESYIAYWISEQDQGQSDALNKGYAKATGEIYGWMNSDDIYLPNTFHTIAEEYKNNKFEVIYGHSLTINEKNQILKVNFSFPFSEGQLVHEGFVAVTQSIFWTKHIHAKTIGFDVKLFANMDLDFYLALNKIHSISKWKFTNQMLGCFRKQKNQKTSYKYNEIIKKDLVYIEGKYNIKLIKNPFRRLFYRLKRILYYFYFPLKSSC